MSRIETIPPRPTRPMPGTRPSAWRYVLVTARILQVRLRFFLILAVAFLVVGRWDVLRNYWDRLTRAAGGGPLALPVSGDTEYFCPMCPGVLSDWPSKCPVCNMTLVRRKRGEATPLPNGVLARMQLAPYRLQLAGVQTSPVAYRTLVYEVVLTGFVEGDEPRADGSDLPHVHVRAEVFEKDFPLLAEGQAVEAASDAFPGRPPFAGRVRKLGTRAAAEGRTLFAWLEIDNPRRDLRPAMLLTARVKVPATQVDVLARLPLDAWKNRTAADLAAQALLVSWCGAVPGGLGPLLQAGGEQCLLRNGQLLSLPESAVVDTGAQKVVYVEAAPGMFDGVDVLLGRRSGDFYPILRGVDAGQRVATAGAFLIDAETRLNPSLAASYFGAGRNEPGERSEAAPPSAKADGVQKALRELAPEDFALAVKQKLCPVTGQPLGSMGRPSRAVVEGRIVFLCCEGCEAPLKRSPEKYLAKLPGN
jgi:hypothetical protein